MRGYENHSNGFAKSRESSYESPCGVMSSTVKKGITMQASLRIPMRGYKTPLRFEMVSGRLVTNPHAGL